MEINLSIEMIQNICETAFCRINDLKTNIDLREYELNCPSIILNMADSEIRRKKAQLTELKTSLEKAREVHELFIDCLKQIESEEN